MKKLVTVFLWFCTAILLGQLCIVGMAVAKGYFTSQTLTQIVALLNGIDIQTKQLQKGIQNAKALPTPTYQEILDATVRAGLQSDTYQAALDRYKRQLDEKARALKEESDRHNALVAEFKRKVDETRGNKEVESQQQIQEILEAQDPAEAKQQLLFMLEKERKAEVISILKALDSDKKKKILAEFTDKSDQQKIAEIIEEIRLQGKSADLVGTQP